MGVFENMAKETVSKLALREPVLVKPSDTIRQVVQQMRQSRLGCAIVVDDDRKPLGTFTEGMLTQMITREHTAIDDAVEKHMETNFPWGRLDDPIVDVLGAMELRNVRFVCVVDQENHVVGLTGQRGLMEYVADHFPGEVYVQRIGGDHPQEREGA